MRRKFVKTSAILLAFIMIASILSTIIPLLIHAEDRAYDTSTPNFIYDFTTEEIYSSLAGNYNLSITLKDGYTTFEALGNDPQTGLIAPSCKPSEAKYALISYYTTATYKGEFFCTRSDNSTMGTSGTHQQWNWNASGNWETILVSLDAWSNADENVTFKNFRFDPLQDNVNVKTGSTIDIKFIAFFTTESDAKNFNFDEYKAKLAYEEEQKRAEEESAKEVDWPDPTYTEMTTIAEDTNSGTLKYKISADGSTVTISYEVNGETLSYTVPNNNNYMFGGYAGTDDLNRPLYDSSEVGSYEAGKREIGLFYFLWHGEHGDSGVFDLQKIIDEVGIDAADNVDCGKYGPAGAMHWFAEPLYGYYYANDAWVLRKHAELLTMANIDFLFFDVTNAHPYINNALRLMECLHELNEQGFDAPQVVFYTNTNAQQTVQTIYNAIYKQSKYPDTWFMMDGKPVIVAPYEANINDFFTIQQNQWPNDPNYKENGWPWMDFEWPQRVFLDENGIPNCINVSVAQHSGTVCFSHSSLYNNYNNRGRSYTNPDGYPSSHSRFGRSLQTSYKAWQADQTLTNYGLNFQAQWDHALSTEAPIILVTGWNEWVAQRQSTDNDKNNPGWIYFVDTASAEFSRDTEMMRGGYFDNYYIQLIYNVQKAKGTAPVIVQDARNPINVTGEFDQWNNVTVTYNDAQGDCIDRDAIGFGHTPYTNTSGRNDIVSAKVTSDTKNIYFYVSTVDDISMFDTSSSWMQLYVNVDRRDDETGESGWYGYDFIINHKAKDAFTTTVAKYNGEGNVFSFETVGEVSYRAKDNEMMIAVPLEMLGIEGYKEINLEFKWADSDTTYDEMEDFYCDGDVAPLGRLNYIYQNYIPGVSQITYPETETQPDTEVPTETTNNPTDATEKPIEQPTEDSTETPSDEPKSGCKSSILNMTAVIFLVSICGMTLLRKKDE